VKLSGCLGVVNNFTEASELGYFSIKLVQIRKEMFLWIVGSKEHFCMCRNF